MFTPSKTSNDETNHSAFFQVNSTTIQKIKDLFDQILIDYKILKNYSNKNDTTNMITILSKQIEQLNFFLLQFISDSKSKANRFKNPSDPVSSGHLSSIEKDQIVNDEMEFIQKNDQQIVEIIVHIGYIINNLKFPLNNDRYLICLKYAELVVNLAEKSSIKLDHMDALNQLVDFFLKISFDLLEQNSAIKVETKTESSYNFNKLSHEIYRALGSLIYQNGTKLSDSNMQRLLNTNNTDNTKNGLLIKILDQIGKEMNKNTYKSDEQTHLINKLKLLLTQLVFNLTLPVIKVDNTSTSNNTAFIDDKYKSKCVYILIKIIRFHNLTEIISSGGLNDFDEKKEDHTRLLIKALQALENLFSSLELTKMTAQPIVYVEWLQSPSNEYQLGDILAIVKALSFYGIQKKVINQHSKQINNILNESQQQLEVKLEPSNMDILLNNEDNLKSLNINEEEIISSIDYGNIKSTDKIEQEGDIKVSYNKKSNKSLTNTKNGFIENKSRQFFSKSDENNDQNNRNKRYLKNNNFNKKGSISNFTSNHSNETTLATSTNLNDTLALSRNSTQCLREINVPLVQYKNNQNSNEINNATPSDSEASTDSSFMLSSNFHLEKCNAKVRVAAIGVLLTAFQTLDKRTILSYWDSFLGSNQNLNLIWSVKNDHSPKVRLIASTALACYLEHVRAFFTITAAEDNLHSFNSLNTATNTSASSFLSTSYTIASLIRQLHRDLLNSICKRETFNLNIIQLLKCLNNLIKATPYQKLKPGLILKLITSLNFLLLKHFQTQNKSLNLLNEIFNCLQILLTNHHQIAEVHLALITPISNKTMSIKSASTANIDELNEESTTYLSSQLENFKIPSITPSRVTYFYEGNTPSSYGSSSVSGYMTPSFSHNFSNDTTSSDGKCWLVNFCIENSMGQHQNLHISSCCIDLLQIICKKYFDLLRRDLFFDQMTQLLLSNIELKVSNTYSSLANGIHPSFQDSQLVDQVKLKSLKLFEEFARCLATNELRSMNGIDLNDCSKFWSQILNSKLVSEILCDETRYMLSSTACDCLSSIGASIFELLPFQKRIYCLTNLLHLTKSQSSLIRSASARALGVYVTFTSLKEDQTFLNDLSECLIGLLSNDTNNLVRQKTAWSLSNLSEVLVENGDKLAKTFTDEFSLSVWQRLLDTASNLCSRESDKLKSYLVRTLGNLINYITLIDHEYIKNQLKLDLVIKSITRAIEALCSCKSVKMLKVKWNLSHAIGVAMRRFNMWNLQLSNPKWLQMFYDTLLELFTLSNNFKVRINACIALMNINLNRIDINNAIRSPQNNSTNPNATNESSIYFKLWFSLVDNFTKITNENISLLDATNEIQHKTTLIHQLCKLFTYLCKYLRIYDLEDLMINCLNNLKIMPSNTKKAQEHLEHSFTMAQLRSYLVSYIRKIFEHYDENKQEVQFYNEALTQIHLLNSQNLSSLDEDCIRLLSGLLQKPTSTNIASNNSRNESESSETEQNSNGPDSSIEINDKIETCNAKSKEPKKFPFKQIYD